MNVRPKLGIDELALPAVCGQTGKPLLMVIGRQGRGVLELIRAVAIEPSPSAKSVPAHRTDPPLWAQAPVPSNATSNGGAGRGMAEAPAPYFQALTVNAKVDIGSLYEGCPYCRATGYFHCGCGMFSCWNRHNLKPHLDHTDIWCAACRSWKCTSDEAEGDDSLSTLTAYSTRENTVELQSRIVRGTPRDQISRSTSIRGYLR